MSIEIGNLKVTVSVNQAKSEGGEGSSTPVTETDAFKKSDPEKLTQDIIEQIVKILDDKKER
ncbi:MAG: hypothetical protein KFF73_02175 [Cyclobacteriaceae bacterium]|nr:hypothetical protein [Cyclobacteriaceae bacterium]